MSFYENCYCIKGEMTLDQAMFAIKDAYERKQNFEEMGIYVAREENCLSDLGGSRGRLDCCRTDNAN